STHFPYTTLFRSINIGFIKSPGLLRESFKLMLETRVSNRVLIQGHNYKDLEQVEQALDIVLIDLPNILRYSEEVSPDTFSENNKLIVLAKAGEEHYVIETIKAGAYGFLLEEMEAEEFLYAVEQVAQGKYYIHGRASHHLMTLYDSSTVEKRGPQEKNNQPRNPITKRAFQALQHVAQGLNNEEISQHMGISDKTVKNHLANVLAVLQVRNRTEAVITAIQNGWMEVPKPKE